MGSPSGAGLACGPRVSLPQSPLPAPLSLQDFRTAAPSSTVVVWGFRHFRVGPGVSARDGRPPLSAKRIVPRSSSWPNRALLP